VTLDDAWDWLSRFTNLEKVQSATKRTWRLDRMQALLAERGHPEVTPIGFHLAGSKGKGSTAAFLSSILTAAGYSTGLYISPHIADWRERITDNGNWFNESVYIDAVAALRTYWEGMSEPARVRFVEDWGGEPTTFEWLTLASFEIFREQTPQARVIETGLGGRLDATNTFVPTASVLTLIELEHTDILGDTRALIAGEKAGILKPGVPALVAPQTDEAMAVFRQTAASVGAPLYAFEDEVEESHISVSREGTQFSLKLRDGAVYEAVVPLLGHAQGLNAAFAAWTAHRLVLDRRLDLGPNPTATIRRGLESVSLRGRMQILSSRPWTVLDGAHTAESAKLLALSWRELFGEGGTLVFGAFEGKAVEPMAAALAPLFSRVVVTPPGTFRPSNPEGLRRAFFEASGGRLNADIAPDPKTALTWAQTDGKPVLVCGSFYLVGEILKG
jgi:dihydrofolate synthase/folylpolyglutamate synthase